MRHRLRPYRPARQGSPRGLSRLRGRPGRPAPLLDHVRLRPPIVARGLEISSRLGRTPDVGLRGQAPRQIATSGRGNRTSPADLVGGCRRLSARCRCQSMTSLTAERVVVSSTRFLRRRRRRRGIGGRGPVHTAIGILEHLTTNGHLFPLRPAWLDSASKRPGCTRLPRRGPGEAGTQRPGDHRQGGQRPHRRIHHLGQHLRQRARAAQRGDPRRPDRQDRHRQGKSDPLDAVSAARAAQSGRAAGVPRGVAGRWR
jgi:hypothetical protein